MKNEQVIDHVHVPQLIDPARQAVDNDPGPPLEGDIVASALTLLDDNDLPLVRSVNFTIGVTDRVAIVGPSRRGMDLLSYMLAGLIAASSGVLRIGGRHVEALPGDVHRPPTAPLSPHDPPHP